MDMQAVVRDKAVWRQILVAADPDDPPTDDEVAELASSSDGTAALASLWQSHIAAGGRETPTDEEIRAALMAGFAADEDCDEPATEEEIRTALDDPDTRKVFDIMWQVCRTRAAVDGASAEL